MSLDLYRISQGLDIQTDDLSSNAYVLQGTGAPGADGGVQDAAPIGSIYMRTDVTADELQVYYKWQSTNSAADWRVTASKAYVDTAVQGISWREPVRYYDSVGHATVAAAVADLNADDQLGTEGTVAAGDRILFPAMGAGDGGPNVFIVGGSTGAWTLTEDTNNETDGDAVLINEGSEADSQWIYDGTNWIKFGGAGSAAELQAIRDFIGKNSAGAVSTGYPSNDLVIDGQSLEHEIGRLDDAVGPLTFVTPNVLTDYSDTLGTEASPGTAAASNITTNLQAIDDGFGTGVISPSGANMPLAGNLVWNGGTLTITDALDALNEGIGDRTYTNDFLVTDGQTVAGSIDALDSAIGDLTNSSAYTAGGYVTTTTLAGNTVQETVDTFNQVIGDLVDDTNEATGSVVAATPTVLDSIPTTEATEVKWVLQVKDASGNRRAIEIHALTDGTNIDWNRSSILRLGNTGSLGVSVAINAGNIEFSVNTAANVDYTIKRVTKSFL